MKKLCTGRHFSVYAEIKMLLGVILFFTLLWTSPVLAVKVSSLYQVEVPVAAQTDDLKAQAVKEGFLEVLIKLTGDAQIGNNPIVKASMQRPDYYVQEFSYSPSTTDSSQYILRIRYESSDINRLLKKAGISYWGETRPLILVWLAATSQAHHAEIIGHEMPGTLFSVIRHQSKKYGLPMIFPVMDVADVSQISPEDITTVALPTLKEAAKRYAPDALLIGKIQQDNDRYESEWQLILNKEQWKWVIVDKTHELIVASLMNQISQALAKHYVVKEIDNPDRWLSMEVMNITQRDDLAALLKYLKQLAPVKQVQLLEVSSDVVELSIQIRGSLDNFQKNAAIGERLNLKYQDPKSSKLFYVWVH